MIAILIGWGIFLVLTVGFLVLFPKKPETIIEDMRQEGFYK